MLELYVFRALRTFMSFGSAMVFKTHHPAWTCEDAAVRMAKDDRIAEGRTGRTHNQTCHGGIRVYGNIRTQVEIVNRTVMRVTQH
jgi:hypothetical protein